MQLPEFTDRRIFFGIFTILLVFAVIFRYWNHSYVNIIASDGKGYYAYLPAIFIYQDLNFDYFFNGKLLLENTYTSSFLFLIDGHDVIKYPCGVAVMILPFFLLAIPLSFLTGLPVDGYSFWFQILTSISAITYTCLGSLWLYKLLKATKIDLPNNIITILGIIFGTNLLVYTIWDPSMSHAFSFSMISLFSYKVHQITRNYKGQDLLIISMALGLIILIRPVNILILFIVPALIPNYGILKFQLLAILKNPIYLLGSILICSSLIALQPLLWFLQNGHWYVWTYLGESFNFYNPEIIKILVSFRKGWLIYTPLMLLIIPGLFVMLKNRQFISSAIFFLFISMVTYVLASWWCWYYGGSFGQRSFIDFYSILALPIAYSLQYIQRNPFRPVLISFVGICVILNLIQSYQYKNNILHYDSMTKEGYFKVFLRTSDKYKWSLFGNENNRIDSDISNKIISSYFQDFEFERPFSWYKKADDLSDEALSGNKVISCHLQTDPVKFEILSDSTMLANQTNKKLRFSGWFLGNSNDLTCQILFIQNNDTLSDVNISNQQFETKETKNKWKKRTFDFPIISKMEENSKIVIVFNNFPKSDLFMDDVLISIYKNTP